MPASMIRAPTGGRPKVIGSSMAMVATEPMPGSTPISVPTSAPMRQNNMFHGVAATEKPSARLARRSCMTDSLGSEPRPELERQIQQIYEQQHGKRRHDDARDEGFDPSGFSRAEPGDDERREGGEDETELPDRQGEDEDRHRDPKWSAHRITFERLALGKHAHRRDGNAEREQDYGKQPRCRPRPKREPAQAGQVARRPERKQAQCNDRQAAVIVLRIWKEKPAPADIAGHDDQHHRGSDQTQGDI